MTKRPQSHQTDRQAIAAFNSLVPPNWIVREKGQDYGVDLEVEIFDGLDRATSTIFYVQMKGTASADYERRASIKIETLEYLLGFTVPSIVGRYCIESRRLYWIWMVDAARQVEGARGKTVSLVFDYSNLWTKDSPSEVEETLKTLRKIQSG